MYLIGRVSQDLVVTPQGVFNFQGSRVFAIGKVGAFSSCFGCCRVNLIGLAFQEMFVTLQGVFTRWVSFSQGLFVTPRGVFNWLVRSTVNQHARCRFLLL